MPHTGALNFVINSTHCGGATDAQSVADARKWREWNGQMMKSMEQWATASLLASTEEDPDRDYEHNNNHQEYLDDMELFGWHRKDPSIKFRCF